MRSDSVLALTGTGRAMAGATAATRMNAIKSLIWTMMNKEL